MKFTGVLVNLDGQPDSFGDVIDSDCEIDIAEKIFVLYEFDQESLLGFAKLVKEDSTIKYEIEITNDCLPEEDIKLLAPCVGGSILKREGRKITKMSVNHIGLSIEGNSDPRIKSMGEQK